MSSKNVTTLLKHPVHVKFRNNLRQVLLSSLGIMTDVLDGHHCSVTIGGRFISNLRFADDIDGLAGNEEELRQLVNRLKQNFRNFGMEISAEKTNVMVNKNANGFSQAVLLNNSPLDPVHQFIYLGAIICDEGSRKEVLSRIAQATSALAKLKPIWDDKNISDPSKIRLLRALAI